MTKTNEDLFFTELIDEITKQEPTKKELNNLKTSLAKKYSIGRVIKNTEIIANSPNKHRQKVIDVLNIKPVRELSGVSVVALFAKPHKCPHGKCIYCPGGIDSDFGDTPQSYTGKEPAALRAIRNNYDPYFQVFNRLEHYVANGHFPDKIELIFMGGTFPHLDRTYTDEFVNYVYKAINDFGDEFIFFDRNNVKQINYDKFNSFFEISLDLNSKERQDKIFEKMLELKDKKLKYYQFEMKRNETANLRSVGLTIETKPDYAKKEHCDNMLEYGCTRFEIGVQSLDNNVLKQINRGHDIKDTKEAFQIMKDMCFKINAHMMIGLPFSTLKNDEKSLKNLFQNEDYRPDMLKIYPCLVVKGTKLFEMHKSGLYKAQTTKEIAKSIAKSFKYFPRYVRIMRVQRDIPTPNIESGVMHSNLREYVDLEMKKLNIQSLDIRAREVGLKNLKLESKDDYTLKIEKYTSSKSIDFFIEYVDNKDSLIGFIRLRFPYEYNLRKEITKGTALIRELHVYGKATSVGNKSTDFQHKGFGKKLLEKAENIAKKEGYTKIAIISGIGVREYYRKQGYKLEGAYMTKEL